MALLFPDYQASPGQKQSTASCQCTLAKPSIIHRKMTNLSNCVRLPFGNEGTQAMSTSLCQLLRSVLRPEDSRYQLCYTFLQCAESLLWETCTSQCWHHSQANVFRSGSGIGSDGFLDTSDTPASPGQNWHLPVPWLQSSLIENLDSG